MRGAVVPVVHRIGKKFLFIPGMSRQFLHSLGGTENTNLTILKEVFVLQKQTIIRRCGILTLTGVLLLTLSVPALALFGKKTETAAASSAKEAPIAQELAISTYRNIPYYAQFLAKDTSGSDLTYSVVTQPKRGTIAIDGANFTYTPGKDKVGTDTFTYVATDPDGNSSTPAAVSVSVQKVRSGVTYADTGNSTAAAAAQYLAEKGIFTGTQIGDKYYFEPARSVSRSEFLAMAMETANLSPDSVTMTGFCDDDSIPAWAKDYAAAGLADGLVEGVSTTKGVAFRADKPITVDEAAVILNRMLAVDNVDLTTWFADRNAAPAWAAQAVGNMEAVNVLAAGSFGSGTETKQVTRADAAKMLTAAKTLMDGKKTTGIFDWLG